MATTRSMQTSAHCQAGDGRGIRDVSDVLRRQAASVNVPANLTSVDFMQITAAWAEGLARALLADSLSRRWSHVQGVAARARTLKPSLGTDADLIEAAAWLHDIGYLPELAHTGLHGLDGARYLRDVQHADPLLCRLVAHHSYAVIEAEERGLADVLTREFAPPPQPLADALTFCDMTTSPDGDQVQVTHRLAEIHDRYGTGHRVSRSIRRATPMILEAVGHVSAGDSRAYTSRLRALVTYPAEPGSTSHAPWALCLRSLSSTTALPRSRPILPHVHYA